MIRSFSESLFNQYSFYQFLNHSIAAVALVWVWYLFYAMFTGDIASVPGLFEGAATWLTLVCVLLANRQNNWTWPTGIISVLMFGWIFYEAQLYSSAVMNALYYFPVQFLGWYQWVKGGKNGGERTPVWAYNTERFEILLGILVCIVGWAVFLHWTDAVSIWWDAAILGISIVAQWIMNYKRIEAWFLWIAVDIISPIIYWTNGLYLIASLYALFLGIAIHGAYSWWKDEQIWSIARKEV